MSKSATTRARMVKLKKGIPFEVKIPNEETQKVIRDSRKGINVTTQTSLDDYFEKIDMASYL